jgi:hypothetical protein
MPQVMEAWSDPAYRRLEGSPPDDLYQQVAEGDHLIALTFVVIPQKGGRMLYRCLSAGTGVKILLKHRHHTRLQWEPTGLEELGLADRQGRLLGVEIADGQADEFAEPQPCAVGQQHTGGERERP